jgi:hypothetical protein
MAKKDDAPAPEGVTEMLLDLWAAKITLKDTLELKDDSETELITALRQLGLTKIETDTDDFHIAGTLVEGELVRYDETKMKDIMAPTLWSRVSTRVLDKAKLEQEVARGNIPPRILDECTEVVPKKPYVLVKESARPNKKKMKRKPNIGRG